MTTDKTPATLATAKHGGCVQLGQQDLSTSEGGRKFIAEYFTRVLHRHDFTNYITTRLAADFACALAQHLSAQPSPGGQGDALHEAVGHIFGCDGSPWRTRDVAAVLRDYAALATRQPAEQQGDREQFEARFRRYNLATKQDSMDCTVYADKWVQGAWVGWQAALATRQPEVK